MRKVNVCSLRVFFILCNFRNSQFAFLTVHFWKNFRHVCFDSSSFSFKMCFYGDFSLEKVFLFVLKFVVKLSCSFSLLEKDKIWLYRKKYPTIGNALLEQRLELTELVRRRVQPHGGARPAATQPTKAPPRKRIRLRYKSIAPPCG